MTLMVFAAGEGTRLRPHTDVLPKPAIPFLGIPLVFWGLDLFKSFSLNHIVVNTYHLPNRIKATFQNKYLEKVPVNFSDEVGTLMGSGGGLLKAKMYLPTQSFFVMNGDEFLVPNDPEFLRKAWEFHQKENNLITMVTTTNPDVGTKFGGVWVDRNQNVMGFGKTKVPGSVMGQHNVGLMIIHPNFFRYFGPLEPTNILYDHATRAIAAGEKVKSFPQQMVWFETGNIEDFMIAQNWCIEEISRGTPRGKHMIEFIKKINPDLNVTKSTSGILIADKSLDLSGVTFRDYAIILKGASFAQPCRLERVVIGENVSVNKEKISDDMILS